MTVAKTLAYYDMAKIMDLKSLIFQDPESKLNNQSLCKH